MKNKKGFTLIELLAVIVILGLLMAIAIPSVTKYITQSRKKTVVSTIGNYIGALVNDVNDLSYTFTASNTVYAVPIECVALERGGTNPFGAWYQANDAYWAYVLVQYDDNTSSYTYGYTFKDSAGYGLYPTSQAKLNEGGKQIQTGLKLNRPKNGNVTDITATTNWNGFNVNDTTELVVLKAEREGNIGDGKTTCTLQQKGDNYEEVNKESGEGSSVGVLYYEKEYEAVLTSPFGDIDRVKYIFHEDGSATGIINGFEDEYPIPAGIIVYEEGKFYVPDDFTAYISDDKKSFYFDYEPEVTFKLVDGKKPTAQTATETLADLILKHNTVQTEPAVTPRSTTDGLYSSTSTNSGKTTYYFKGNVQNNNVKFAGYDWKIIRVNEDGSVRLILNKGTTKTFVLEDENGEGEPDSYKRMYYSNSDMKKSVDKWYEDNINKKGYDSYVVTSMFCEEARRKFSSSATSGNATMNYAAEKTFKCATDGNGKGVLNMKVGLISVEETIFAGLSTSRDTQSHYLDLKNPTTFGTMSPAGFGNDGSKIWQISGGNKITTIATYDAPEVRPVINISSTALAIGTGTASDPYIVKTN